MTSTSEEELLKAEIAKLSGVIQTHKQQQHHQPYPSYPEGYTPRGRGYYRGAGSPPYHGTHVRGRGGFYASANAARGRGRGAVAIAQRNRTLILNDSNHKGAMQGAAPGAAASTENANSMDSTVDSSKPAAASTATSSTKSSMPGTSEGWIKRKSTHNMSLVSTSTFQRTEPARLAAMEATRKAKAEAKAAASSSNSTGRKTVRAKPIKPSSSVRRGDNMGEVVIDGVVFEFDPSGTKLVKKAVQPFSNPDDAQNQTPCTSTANECSTAVPLKTSINGQDYIRTKRGNLISADLLAKRKAQREAQAKMGRLDKMVGQISAMQATRNSSRKPGVSRRLDVSKARTLCTFFNKTGQCKRGLSCPYLHDSSKIALCPKVLRPTGCTLPKGTCPLSHTPRAERVPHCVHYLRSRNCRNGADCLYTHADLKDGVKTNICRDFSDYGWCGRGKDCEQRHTYECPEFVEKGKCERKGCKLVHVIRASRPESNVSANGVEATQGGVQDDDLFVRDDAAAEEAQADLSHEHAEHALGGTKRKRPLMQTELDDDQPILPDDEDEDEQVNFANINESRRTKRRKAKAFTQQKDFISFDDIGDEQEDDDDDDGESDEQEDQEIFTDEEEEGEEEDSEEAESVHSEDFELSDQQDDSDEHITADDNSNAQDLAPADDEQDDDLVDRDL